MSVYLRFAPIVVKNFRLGYADWHPLRGAWDWWMEGPGESLRSSPGYGLRPRWRRGSRQPFFRDHGERERGSGVIGDRSALMRGWSEQGREAGLQPGEGGFGFHGAGPNGDDMPAERAELVFDACIARFVAGDFRGPPRGAGCGHAEVRAIVVTVPKTPVHEDDGAARGQDDVGFAGQGFVARSIDGEPVAEPVEQRADLALRPGVATEDTRHDLGAFFGGPDVGHGEDSRPLRFKMQDARYGEGGLIGALFLVLR